MEKENNQSLFIFLQQTKPSQPNENDIKFLENGKCESLEYSEPSYCSVPASLKCSLQLDDSLVRSRCCGFTSEGTDDENEVFEINKQEIDRSKDDDYFKEKEKEIQKKDEERNAKEL